MDPNSLVMSFHSVTVFNLNKRTVKKTNTYIRKGADKVS